MSVVRIMGIETEYGGLSRPSARQRDADVQPGGHGLRPLPPTRTATAGRAGTTTWRPAARAPAVDMSRAEADPSQPHRRRRGMANVILTNGARCTSITRIPSTPTPEVPPVRRRPLRPCRASRSCPSAGEWPQPEPGAQQIRLYKNNTDNKGASYGCHENYLMPRPTPFCRSSCQG